MLLAQNVQTLLSERKLDKGALAAWCGHKPAWLSKILAGTRSVRLIDLGRMADFFGLTTSQLFQHGISQLTERRIAERRGKVNRRTGFERRDPERIYRVHPDLERRRRNPKVPK